MMDISWFSKNKLEEEKKELKAELTMKVMKVERRRGEVEEVAKNVIDLMNRKGNANEKT